MKSVKIILLCGKKRVGKDTVAEYLVKKYGYKQYGLADNLKKMAQDLVKLMYNMTYFDNPFHTYKKDKCGFSIRKSGSVVSVKEVDYIDKPNILSFRSFLQKLGTDVLRNTFGNDIHCRGIWSKIVEQMNDKSGNDNVLKVVISDCRFEDEMLYFVKKMNKHKNIDVKSIMITRTPKVEENLFKDIFGTDDKKSLEKMKKKINDDKENEQFLVHPSELVSFKTNYRVENNGSFNELYQKIDNIMG